VLSGVESEKEDGLKICEAVNNKRCINFIGKTNLRELFDLFNVSDVLVSNDSGPPHFASMTNIKVIVLFGPESPALYAPLGKNIHVLYSNFACSPCVSAYTHRKSACRNNKCLKAITPDMVFNEVLSCLREGEGRQE
jgi:ADP-heptose:LPS heptosyltransferase